MLLKTVKKWSAILHKSGMAFIKNNGQHIRWTCKDLCGIVWGMTNVEVNSDTRHPMPQERRKIYEYSSLLPCINRKGRSVKFP